MIAVFLEVDAFIPRLGNIRGIAEAAFTQKTRVNEPELGRLPVGVVGGILDFLGNLAAIFFDRLPGFQRTHTEETAIVALRIHQKIDFIERYVAVKDRRPDVGKIGLVFDREQDPGAELDGRQKPGAVRKAETGLSGVPHAKQVIAYKLEELFLFLVGWGRERVSEPDPVPVEAFRHRQ